jgi:hypothetical protein
MLGAFQQAMLDFSADDLASLFAPDAIYEFPFLAPQRSADHLYGRAAIRADFTRVWGSLPAPPVTGFRDVRVHDTTDPEVVIAELEFDAIDHLTGRTFTSRSLLILRSHDGEIQHLRDYSDVLRVSKGLGRLPQLFDSLRED